MGRRRPARGRHRAGSAARGAAARRPALGRGAGRAGRAHGRRPDLVGRHVAGGDGEPATHRGRAGPVDGSRAASGKVWRARCPLPAAAPRGAGARARTAPVRGQRDRGAAPVRRAARGRPVRAGRPESRHAGRVQAAGPGRGELGHGARPGGVRDGQGGRRPRHAPERTARVGRVRRGQLRRDPREPARERVVRSRKGRVYGRRHSQDRALRASGERYPVPRRDRRHEPRAAGEDPARGAGARDRAGGGRRDDPHRRAPHRGHQPRSQGGDQAGALPRRPLLSPRGRHDPAPDARGAGRRSGVAHRLLRPPVRRPLRQRDSRDLGPRARAASLPRLRALLVSIARPDEATMWSSSGPYLTLGKRGVHPDELRRRMPQAFHRIMEHLQALFKAQVEALECQQRGDAPGVVAALLRAGRLEEEVDRDIQARAWYEVALRVAEALQDRRPEVEALHALGYVCLALGEYAAGARHFQRSLALAEAEFDQAGATAASEGLGDVALAQGQWGGAQAWYSRGLRLAEAASDAPRAGRLERQLGVMARKQRDLAAAGEFLRRARERFEAAGPPDEMARVLNEQGRLDAQLGRYTAASAAYREALAWAQRAPRDARLELSIRLNLAELDLEAGRLLEAEAELRRAEQVAIGGPPNPPPAPIYTPLGPLAGAPGDRTRCGFFGQALQLARAVERAVATQAPVYHADGLFRPAIRA